MKNWWLELYTIPFLKKLGIFFLLISVCVNLCGIIVPSLTHMVALLGTGLIGFITFRGVTLSRNLEFHKLQIPFPVLRSILLKDVGIQTFSSILAVLLLELQMMIYVKASFADVFVVSSLFSVVITFLNLLKMTNQGPVGKPLYEMMDRKKYFLRGMLTVMLMVGCAPFLMLPFAFLHVPFEAFGIIGGLTFLFATLFFFLKAAFNQEVKKGSPITLLKYTFKGALPALAVCLTLMTASRGMVSITSLDPAFRVMLFEFSGPLAPELDVSDALVFLKAPEKRMRLIFAKTPGLGQVPLSDIDEKWSPNDYVTYLLNARDKSLSNLAYILQKVDSNEKPSREERIIAELIVRKWPKGQELPKKIMAKKMNKEEIPQEERLPASDEQEE